MGMTLAEYRAYVEREKQKKGEQQDLVTAQQLIKSAAVAAEKLVGQPEWDKFLQMVQARRNAFAKLYEDWRERLEMAGSDEAVKQAQVNVAINRNCMLVLDEIMELPQSILKGQAHVNA